ncbi:restriction endonuclease subunit S [Kitasatospora sp. NPDC096128]|uniref:restriction endonuclease subunit S n=1 Tax=Kitasatospora sp. NPDC096128 TaxID=3155547 RepID=UPI00333126E8
MEETKLPEGWAWATVAEVGEVELGRQRHPDWHTGPEMRPYLRVANVFEDRIDTTSLMEMDFSGVFDKYQLQAGDILLNEGQSPHLVGRPALYRGEPPGVAFTNSLLRFQADDGVLPEWALLVFRHHLHSGRFMREARITTNIAHLSAARLKPIEFPVPPTAEQHRIIDALGARLTRLDELESRLVAAQQRLEKLRDFVMTAAATGALAWDADPQHMPIAGSLAVKDGALPPLASGWQWGRLQDIADVVGGVTKDSKNQHNPDLPEVPYLRVANAQRARLDLSQVAKIRVAPKALDKLRLRDGDLLMSEGGDRDKLGRGWIWEEQIKDCIHQNHLFRARIQGSSTHPKLLGWYVNSAARSWFEANGKQSVNLASISISKVKLLPVPVPPPDEEKQAAFVELGERVLARFDHLVTACENGLAHANALRHALLAEAFAGRLVPQDPDDESAEDLPKRIRAEREAAEAERKAVRRATQVRRKSPVGPKASTPAQAPPPPARTSDTPLSEGEQNTLPLEFNA